MLKSPSPTSEERSECQFVARMNAELRQSGCTRALHLRTNRPVWDQKFRLSNASSAAIPAHAGLQRRTRCDKTCIASPRSNAQPIMHLRSRTYARAQSHPCTHAVAQGQMHEPGTPPCNQAAWPPLFIRAPASPSVRSHRSVHPFGAALFTVRRGSPTPPKHTTAGLNPRMASQS